MASAEDNEEREVADDAEDVDGQFAHLDGRTIRHPFGRGQRKILKGQALSYGVVLSR